MSEKVKIKNIRILSDEWYTYKQVTFEIDIAVGNWKNQKREVLDRGDGATILLYNQIKKTVILTRQFRLPTYLNGNPTGQLIEACAGSVEKNESPEENIKRETLEETGYKITSPQKVFEAYMSPGAVTEKIHFFVAAYDDSMKIQSGGGHPDENEYIEVMELLFDQALGMMKRGEIQDAKTIMLLQYALLNQLI
jgi:GDP-mannose pyrophosphatase NudK